jgi:hypothetical protein
MDRLPYCLSIHASSFTQLVLYPPDDSTEGSARTDEQAPVKYGCAIVDSQRLNPDMVNRTEANLRGRHPQLATFGVIPCTNDNMALEFCDGIIP